MAYCNRIHLLWYQGIENAPDPLRDSPARWRALNPGWEVMEWNAANTDEFIAAHYPQHHATWRGLDRVIKKCDMARMLILHFYGGVYADLDLIPRRSIRSLYQDRELHMIGQPITLGHLPADTAPVRANLTDRELILSQEYAPFDDRGISVANGIVISKPRMPLLLDFVDARAAHGSSAVLKFMGPHALTIFLRSRASELRGRAVILPPYYFLWERHALHEEPPSWCVCEHPAVNRWGDRSRKDWWNV